MKYKVLTLTPPWGTLIALGKKRVETRGWHTDYRGKLLIHQGSNLKPVGGRDGLLELCGRQPFFDALYPIVPGHDRYCDRNAIVEALPMGKIVAMCRLVDCSLIGVSNDTPTYMRFEEFPPYLQAVQEPELSFGNYSPGRWAWLLADSRALDVPIPARGYPGLWEWEGEL